MLATAAAHCMALGVYRTSTLTQRRLTSPPLQLEATRQTILHTHTSSRTCRSTPGPPPRHTQSSSPRCRRPRRPPPRPPSPPPAVVVAAAAAAAALATCRRG